MDHCWDGFYTCQKREQRFPTLVDSRADEYNIEYTGTPPNEQEFRLYGSTGSPGFLVTILYPNAGAYAIYDKNRKLIPPTGWDHDAKTWAEVTGQRGCGENRYEGVINRLQFQIEEGCRLFIMPRDAIMLGIRMEFTMDQFFARGGVVTFADRMAAVLGIHKADIKVASVYEGSTIIDFFVQQSEDLEAQLDLDNIKALFTEKMSTLDEFMGSTILGAVANGARIITKGGSDLLDGDGDGTFIWDETDETEDEDKDEEVEIELVYKTKAKEAERTGEVSAYIALLLIIIVVLLIIIIVICIYNRIAMKIQIDKAEQRQRGLDRSLSMQYDPRADKSGNLHLGAPSQNESKNSARALNKGDPSADTILYDNLTQMKKSEMDNSAASNAIEDDSNLKDSPSKSKKKKNKVKKGNKDEVTTPWK